jgi:hypothetical protein
MSKNIWRNLPMSTSTSMSLSVSMDTDTDRNMDVDVDVDLDVDMGRFLQLNIHGCIIVSNSLYYFLTILIDTINNDAYSILITFYIISS